jgi:Family of unknown function (DUF6152)
MKAGAFTGAIVFCAAVIVGAHHGQAGLFDESRIIELKGSVKQWNFINPHPILVLDAPDDKGVRRDWDVYFGPGAVPSLRRQGFAPDTFKVGEIVIVKGHPATSGTAGVDVLGKGTGVTRADGRSVPK